MNVTTVCKVMSSPDVAPVEPEFLNWGVLMNGYQITTSEHSARKVSTACVLFLITSNYLVAQLDETNVRATLKCSFFFAR